MISKEKFMSRIKFAIRNGTVFRMKREEVGYVTDGPAQKFGCWFISAAATPRFQGSHDACVAWIASQDGELVVA